MSEAKDKAPLQNLNSIETFEVLAGSATIQDFGRFGWQRFGVPPSGAMDEHAFRWANKLLNNPPDAPCIEIPAGKFRMRALCNCWIGLTGANLGATLNGQPVRMWRTASLRADDVLAFSAGNAGLWCYLSAEGGFDAPQFFGSASVYERGLLGRRLKAGDILSRKKAHAESAHSIASRFVGPNEVFDYARPLVARVIAGPQEELFSREETATFFSAEYKVTSQIDRVGYRLEGTPIRAATHDIFSEGIAYGAIQIPENGQPIVMMKDRPTVGGYPKIGTLLPEDTTRLAQCRPGQTVRFEQIKL